MEATGFMLISEVKGKVIQLIPNFIPC